MRLGCLVALALTVAVPLAALEPPPPVQWAVPFQRGTVHTLVIAPAYTLTDAAELAKRLDITYETAPVQDESHLGPTQVLDDLHRKLDDDYDVIVIGNLNFTILPDDIVASLLAKVEAGAGLVLVQCQHDMPAKVGEFLDGLEDIDSAPITRCISQAPTPEWPSSMDFVQASVYGKGRIVQLNYPGGRPFSHCLIPSLTQPLQAKWDYVELYFSLVAKAMIWAAGETDSLWVQTIEDIAPKGPDEDAIPSFLPDDYVEHIQDSVARPLFQQYRVRLNAKTERPYQVRLQVRQPQREWRADYPELVPIKKGQDTYLIEVPLGAGQYFLDLWFLDGKKVVAWHTQAVTVSRWPEVSPIVCSKDSLLPNDTVNVSTTVRPHLNRPRTCLVYGRAIDPLGRIVSEASGSVPAEGGTVVLPMRFADLIANLVKIEVFALDVRPPKAHAMARPDRWQLDQAAYACHHLNVRAGRSANAVIFAINGKALPEYGVRKHLAVLSELGVDSVYAQSSEQSSFFSASANMRLIPEITDFVPESQNNGIRQPCLNEPAYQQDQIARIREGVTASWGTGASLYSVGTGNRLSDAADVCFCETCIQGFRRWLQSQFKSIDELNLAWRTAYSSFDTVEPLTREQAVQLEQPAPWLTFRLYMDSVFTAVHRLANEAVRSVDPQARAGFVPEQGRAPYLGYDMHDLAANLDVLVLGFDPLTIEKAVCYRSTRAHTAMAVDATALAGDQVWAQWLPWYLAMHRVGGLWLAPAYGGAESTPSVPAITPDGKPSKALTALAGTVAELKDGLGTMLLNAKPDPAQIAIYDSQPSLYLADLLEMSGGDVVEAQEVISTLLRESGYHYDFLHSTEISKINEYRLVILPAVHTLSDEEIARLCEFSARGGVLFADVLPGQYDNFGIKRTAIPVLDLFGDRQETEKNILLNEPVTNILSDSSRAEKVRKDLADLLIRNEIKPVVMQEDNGGDFEIHGFAYGAAQITALLRKPDDSKKPSKVVIHLDKGRTVYDLRVGKRVSNSAKIQLQLQPGQPALLAALPYQVSDVELTAPPAVQQGQRLALHVSVKTRGGLPGDHLVHISMSHDGNVLHHYDLDLVCPGGDASTYIPLAMNESAGSYIIEATDLLSGVCRQQAITIEERI